MNYNFMLRRLQSPRELSMPNAVLDMMSRTYIKSPLEDQMCYGMEFLIDEVDDIFGELNSMLEIFEQDALLEDEEILESFNFAEDLGELDLECANDIVESFIIAFDKYPTTKRIEMPKDIYRELFLVNPNMFDSNGDIYGIETVAVEDIEEDQIIFCYE